MARKAKRKTARRPPVRPLAQRGTTGSASTSSRSQGATRVGGDQAVVRSVEMSLAPKAAPRRGGRIVLDNADPAIPIDRVPFFVSDLKQLGITAAVMVAILVGGAQLIPLVLK
ncbi:MAG: hypothetical protein M3075_08465 [Candidatus Dormibacteraeota bacterium]|nr:hypothetical protein [Candidatus Dormibacteraeota bacterium]